MGNDGAIIMYADSGDEIRVSRGNVPETIN